MIDIIILSKAETPTLLNLTKQTIETLLASEKSGTFNIIIIEQVKGIEYRHRSCKTILNQDAFHYHKFMNHGISITDNDYVCICNNDLIFEKGWATKLISSMEENGCLSGSPCYPAWQNKSKFPEWANSKVHFDYQIQKSISGWCIMMNRKIFDFIGKLDEDVSFWSSDNVYAEQLKFYNIKHCLDEESIVHHVNGGSSTLYNQPQNIQQEIATNQHIKFTSVVKNKYKHKIQYITASHKPSIYNKNIAKTNITNRLTVMSGYTNISKAYNEAVKWGDYIVFVHHDVWFDSEWESKLIKHISYLNDKDRNWGVLGVAGAIECDNKISLRGHIKDRKNIFGSAFEYPLEVQTLDELLIVVKRSDNIKFDETLLNHFYAVDICLKMVQEGRKNYVIPAYLEHNAFHNKYELNKEFHLSGEIIKNKYNINPITTTCVYYKSNPIITKKNTIMTRTELINSLIQKYGYSKYLEIGVYNNDLNYNHIVCKFKESCDPNPSAGSTHKLTSDDYFKQNKNKFDIIFIDGLHHADQVIKDIQNSLDCLSDNGTIVMHDCLPTNEEMQRIPLTNQCAWTGNTWEAFVYYRQRNKNIKMFVVDTDWGCGIIRKGKQELLNINCDINYSNFVINKNKWMNIIPVERIDDVLAEQYIFVDSCQTDIASPNIIKDNYPYQQIPLIIPNYNQLYCLRNLINWFQYYHKGNPVVVIDNASDYEPLLEYYQLCDKGVMGDITVVRHKVNSCMVNINRYLPTIKNDYYILSNPDIIPRLDVPENYLDIWKHCIEHYGYYKAGFELVINNIPDYNENKKYIQHWEQKLITNNVDIDYGGVIYKAKVAPIDMTYCLYSRIKGGWTREYKNWNNSIRLFESEHLGWYIHPITKIDENINYFTKCLPASDGNGGNNYNPFRPLQRIIINEYNIDHKK